MTRLVTRRAAGEVIANLKVGLLPLQQIREDVEADPRLVVAVAALVHPPLAVLLGALRLPWNEVADQSGVLRTHIPDCGALFQLDGLGGAVTAKAHVEDVAATVF